MQQDKITSYVGFCLRANKVVFGVENLVKSKRCHLYLTDKTLAQNSYETLLSTVQKLKATLLCLSEGTLEEMTHKNGVKAIGLTEKNLAEAIIKEASEHTKYTIIVEGENAKYGNKI